MPYQVNVYRVLSSLGYHLHVFYLDKHTQTPYNPPEIKDVKYYPKSRFPKVDLLSFVEDLKPKLLVTCGWFDKDYLYVSKIIRKKLKIPVICPIDTQLLVTFRQILGILTSGIYIKPCFSHIWVPGFRQYEFARLLGYSKNRILFNSLSGDVRLFEQVNLEKKKLKYPRNFLYVGRYNKVKGLDMLLRIWDKIEDKKGWKLTLIGNGPLRNDFIRNKSVKVLDFMDQQNLVNQAQNAGCFILPSTYEPWALVLHEFAAAGLPIICSDACGASTFFVEHGYNGYIFKNRNEEELFRFLQLVINMSIEDLLLMSVRSRFLAQRVTPELSAFSLIKVLSV